VRFRSATLFCLSLPFVERFSHSLGSRTSSESIVVRLAGEDDVVGHGEGMPRTYVTGEDLESCCRSAEGDLWPRVRGLDLPAHGPAGEGLEGVLAHLDAALPCADASGRHVRTAIRCAFELAILDAWLRAGGRSLAAELPPRQREVVYSAVIPTGSPESAEAHAKQWKVLGFDQVKVKIDGKGDVERVARVRRVFGAGASIRVDGNAAYDEAGALACLRALADSGVVSAEQMLPKDAVEAMARLRSDSPVPLMVDESLVTLADADRLIAARACDLFNVRVSKCGGLGPSLRIVTRARDAGLGYQIGCHVGETAILSAAGRHLAAFLGDARFVEGSFGNLLLKEDVTRQGVRFGHGGRAALLDGPGLGVAVQGDVLARHARQVLELGAPRPA
jgi:muconate cycloisomerase